MTKVKPIKAQLAFTQTLPPDVLFRATAVYAGMLNNPAYPTPPVDMAIFKADIDGLSAAITAALDGGKKAMAELHHQVEVVSKALRQLGHYVEAACKDDVTLFASSGFLAQASVRTTTPPLTESIRKIEAAANSGQLLVTIVADPTAFSYELRWAPVINGTPGAWTIQAVVTTRPATLVENLTPGTTYAFQVRALSKQGYSDWSDSVTRMCT